MAYWLMKSEPDEVSIDSLATLPAQTVPWFGVRNYQARNFMRDAMQVGDLAFFYHSSCAVPGIAGLVTISAPAAPDLTQFDPRSPYFDPKSTPDKPRWVAVSVTLLQKTRFLPLSEMRLDPALAGLALLQRGSRLSITPVSEEDAAYLRQLLGAAA